MDARKRGLLGTCRRIVQRIVQDPMADVVSCGICHAWLPGGSFPAHVAWHRRIREF